MKVVLFLFGIPLAWALGYMSEPALRTTIVGTTAIPQIAAEPPVAPDPEPLATTSTVEPLPTPELTPEPAPETETEPTPEEPETEAEPSAPLQPEPAPEDEIKRAPEEETPPVESEVKSSTGDVDVVKIMQTSLRNREIWEIKANQVIDWKAEPDETFEGVVFQIGIATYKAETFMGEKNILAKALIKNGKVVKWIWPKSGAEIK